MMTYPDNHPDNVSGFESHTGPKPGIPTQIPTKCRDWRLQMTSMRESRHRVAIAGKLPSGPDFHLDTKSQTLPAHAQTLENARFGHLDANRR